MLCSAVCDAKYRQHGIDELKQHHRNHSFSSGEYFTDCSAKGIRISNGHKYCHDISWTAAYDALAAEAMSLLLDVFDDPEHEPEATGVG